MDQDDVLRQLLPDPGHATERGSGGGGVPTDDTAARVVHSLFICACIYLNGFRGRGETAQGRSAEQHFDRCGGRWRDVVLSPPHPSCSEAGQPPLRNRPSVPKSIQGYVRVCEGRGSRAAVVD